MTAAVPAHVALHLSVPTAVAVLVAEAAKHLGGGVPLLGRGLLVVGQDLVDDGLKGAQDGCGAVPGLGERIGLGLGQDLADLVPRVMEHARDRADGHAIAVRPADRSVIIHRKHIPNLRETGWGVKKSQSTRRVLGWVRFRRSFCPRVGPFYALTSIHPGAAPNPGRSPGLGAAPG